MKVKQLILTLLIFWIFGISLCFSENNSGIITIVGSTSAQPLVEELSQVYMIMGPEGQKIVAKTYVAINQ